MRECYGFVIPLCLTRHFGIIKRLADFQGFVAIEALADGGVLMGLPREMSQRLAAQALMVCSLQSSYINITEPKLANPLMLQIMYRRICQESGTY